MPAGTNRFFLVRHDHRPAREYDDHAGSVDTAFGDGNRRDGVARRCFLNGVLAGSPVEFATSTSGTEGGALTMLIRFAGAGGVEYLTGEDAQWTRAFAGIRPAAGGLVFDADGMATRREPVP